MHALRFHTGLFGLQACLSIYCACLVSFLGLWSLVFGIWHLASGIWELVAGRSCFCFFLVSITVVVVITQNLLFR